MSYLVKDDRVHKDPPKCNLDKKNAKKVEQIPKGKEKCDICFGLPR